MRGKIITDGAVKTSTVVVACMDRACVIIGKVACTGLRGVDVRTLLKLTATQDVRQRFFAVPRHSVRLKKLE